MQMKKIINFALLTVFIMSANTYAGQLDGLWNFRANGTEVGFMDLNGRSGKLRAGSSGEDSVRITKLKRTGSIGAKEIRMVRRGSYYHEFVGWVSNDGKHMAGYYIQNSQKLPWSAVK